MLVFVVFLFLSQFLLNSMSPTFGCRLNCSRTKSEAFIVHARVSSVECKFFACSFFTFVLEHFLVTFYA